MEEGKGRDHHVMVVVAPLQFCRARQCINGESGYQVSLLCVALRPFADPALAGGR